VSASADTQPSDLVMLTESEVFGIYRYQLVDGTYERMPITTTTTEHHYVTQNGKVVRETIGTGETAQVLDFTYDSNGRPFALTYTNGTADPVTYYYVLNLQGDVVKLVEHRFSGRVYNLITVAEYTYDAWGKPLSTTDGEGNSVANTHIAKLNPLRYRGYYFDMETGFYYLQSRYYDPTLRRFINADSYQSTGQGILGHNMFAYCLNNPNNRVDIGGCASSLDDDSDGDGIPDYLERRWYLLTYFSKKRLALEKGNLRDVTAEIDAALETACLFGSMNYSDTILSGIAIQGNAYIQFYLMVDHNGIWDIKRKNRWEDTIGTEFPGEDVFVMYRGDAMTPEDLGNYTYARIGRSFGFTLPVLFCGSYHAAGYPKSGDDLWNEELDWYYIEKGYYG